MLKPGRAAARAEMRKEMAGTGVARRVEMWKVALAAWRGDAAGKELRKRDFGTEKPLMMGMG